MSLLEATRVNNFLTSSGQRVRYWAIHNDLISKVLFVVEDISKVLHLQVIKFIKSIFINDDENLNKLIINNNSLAPIIGLFTLNETKDNLILSAILDLFEFIRKQNIKKIISYLFEKHFDFFYKESNRKFFNSLITKYEQGLDQFSSIKVNSVESEDKM
jgi:protein phosphatase-4 regulatory subunit 3